MQKRQVKPLIFVCILLALIITNPKRDDFQEFLKGSDVIHFKNPKKDLYGRKANLIVFSIYTYNEAFHEITNHTITFKEHYFLAVLDNFIKVGDKQKPTGYAWEE